MFTTDRDKGWNHDAFLKYLDRLKKDCSWNARSRRRSSVPDLLQRKILSALFVTGTPRCGAAVRRRHQRLLTARGWLLVLPRRTRFSVATILRASHAGGHAVRRHGSLARMRLILSLRHCPGRYRRSHEFSQMLLRHGSLARISIISEHVQC